MGIIFLMKGLFGAALLVTFLAADNTDRNKYWKVFESIDVVGFKGKNQYGRFEFPTDRKIN